LSMSASYHFMKRYKRPMGKAQINFV
jgi:hypothetical protein